MCDYDGISGVGKHCDGSTASAAPATTATTARHQRRRQALRRPLFTRPAWPRRALRSHDYQRAPRKLSVHAVVLCALCSPLYCPGASRPRQARSRLTSRFQVASYCYRVDLECDKHGIGGGGKHCDDDDAQPDASAAETSTTTATMHSPTAFHTASVAATCATLTRSSTRTK